MEQVLKTRLKTAVVFGIIMLCALLSGKWGLSILLTIVAVGGSHEYLKICGVSKPIYITGVVAVVLLMLSSLLIEFPLILKQGMLVVALVTYTLFAASLFVIQPINHRNFQPFLAIIYPTLSLLLPIIFSAHTVWATHFWLFAFLLIWISDSGAYLVGRKLGKTKLYERISPKKTWEGTLGAGLFTMLGGYIIYVFYPAHGLHFWLYTSLIVWVIGSLGDLYESSIKRTFGVKDSGNFMPGHGGFLDRFDSFLLATPFLTALLYAFKLTT
ncbi:MAG: phosphatidate cytidylyltransferase [Saprospiraceae bacterium]|nr:phosphatidate cytidylyltransferase [Saprospiraceae bacterium]